MEEIKSSKLAFTYAGCFIGAGFLSGNELWQFFGSFGKLGAVALVLAIVLQGVFGFIAIRYAGANNISRFDVLIVKNNNKFLRGFFVITEIVFIFFVISVMLAGAGSLFKTVFNVNEWWTSLIFTVIVMSVAYFGLNGVISIFSSTIPILTVATIIIILLFFIFSLSSQYPFPDIFSIGYPNSFKYSMFLPTVFLSHGTPMSLR